MRAARQALHRFGGFAYVCSAGVIVNDASQSAQDGIVVVAKLCFIMHVGAHTVGPRLAKRLWAYLYTRA